MAKYKWLLIALLVIVAAVMAGVVWAAQPQRFPMNSIVAFVNIGSQPAEVQIEFYEQSTGNTVFTSTLILQPQQDWELDVGVIDAIPAGFRGGVWARSPEPVKAEYRVKPKSMPFTIHNLVDSSSTFDVRYLQGGLVRTQYANNPLSGDQQLVLTPGQFAAPNQYDTIVVASSNPIEGFYTANPDQIRKK